MTFLKKSVKGEVLQYELRETLTLDLQKGKGAGKEVGECGRN